MSSGHIKPADHSKEELQTYKVDSMDGRGAEEKKSRGRGGTSWLPFVRRPEWRQSFASGVSLPWLRDGEGGGGRSVKATTDAAVSFYQSPCTDGERCWLIAAKGKGDEESVCDLPSALLISLLHQFKISPALAFPFPDDPSVYILRYG
ncbi:uncharacterized protein CEXT_80901 [Caerostris extrusa]|uniref:Prolactin receptor n=1 Tax=Caerostris extrusa TaxID=172846 RepID=A0AAV4M4W8_CAEEX|nr:uncharacterized protein CEXT_80901 [Caerostris extrusa]